MSKSLVASFAIKMHTIVQALPINWKKYYQRIEFVEAMRLHQNFHQKRDLNFTAENIWNQTKSDSLKSSLAKCQSKSNA